MSNTGLPDNGFEVPGLCLGTMYFGTTMPEQRAYELLDHYVDAGGQLLDTANNYAFWVEGGCGDESELVLGRWLTSRGNRDQVLLASKIGARPRPGSRSVTVLTGTPARRRHESRRGNRDRSRP